MQARTIEAAAYRLAWRSKITGATGHGSRLSQEVVGALVKEMNQKYPELDHWAEPVGSAENGKGARD